MSRVTKHVKFTGPPLRKFYKLHGDFLDKRFYLSSLPLSSISPIGWKSLSTSAKTSEPITSPPSTSSRMTAANPPTLSLTPREALFRRCLLECRSHMSGTTPAMSDLVLRWTGGWVRDKLLNSASHDIDVALSTMTGMEFGQALQTYLATNGAQYEEQAEREGFKAEFKNLHKIAANPEKSKHLETVTTRMFGIDVDFVNLRKEVYDNISRNPSMEFGTAEEDALRRDATVNALFYNLDTQKVEDFTGRGLDDIRDEIIRTPLAPYQTFRDDPLRVLRLIRFAARLGYRIEESAQQSMADTTIHEALRLKISRERVGVEIGKIVAGPDPYTGLMFIHKFKLYRTVFADPASDFCPNELTCTVVYAALRQILAQEPGLCVTLKPQVDPALAWTLAAYVPWMEYGNQAYTASREGIKATNVVSKILAEAIKNRPVIVEMLESIQQGQATRAQIGNSIRTLGTTWRPQTLYSLLWDVSRTDLDSQVTRYQRLADFVTNEGLEDADSMKPIANGNEIKKALGVAKAGSWLKSALDMVVEWQFQNPAGSKEEAVQMVVSRKDELGIE